MSSHQEAGLRQSGKLPGGSNENTNKVGSGPPPTPYMHRRYNQNHVLCQLDALCCSQDMPSVLKSFGDCQGVSSSQHADLHVPRTSTLTRSVSHASHPCCEPHIVRPATSQVRSHHVLSHSHHFHVPPSKHPLTHSRLHFLLLVRKNHT